MSRIGRKPVTIPSGVTIEQVRGEILVRGPKGSLRAPVPPSVAIEFEGDVVRFARLDESKPSRAYHGLARATVANMVQGVTEGFTRELQIEGVGYRAEAAGQKLSLALGFSHPVIVDVPDGLAVTVEGQHKIRIQGIDRSRVGHFASEIRSLRPPEPYKGKGVRYVDERIRRKVGKAGAS